jgi:ABC-type transport system substrate-binding protein
MTKAFVLSAAMLAALMVPATAQTSSPETAPTPPASSSPASPGAPTSAAPEAGSTTGSTTATTTLDAATRILTVDALEDMDLVGTDGKGIGDIEGVVENNADKKQFVVIERGGFLGFGAKAITLPLENIAVQGEKVTLRNMDVAQLDGLAEFKNDNSAFRDLDDSQQISVPQQ